MSDLLRVCHDPHKEYRAWRALAALAILKLGGELCVRESDFHDLQHSSERMNLRLDGPLRTPDFHLIFRVRDANAIQTATLPNGNVKTWVE